MAVYLLNALFEGAFPLFDLIATYFGQPLLLPGLDTSNETNATVATLWKLACVCFCGIPSYRLYTSGKSDKNVALGSFLYHTILVYFSLQSFNGKGMPVGPWLFQGSEDNRKILSLMQGGVHGLLSFMFFREVSR